MFLALSVSVLYGGLASGYPARLAGYLSTGEFLTMGREVWDMVSDCGSEDWRVAPLLHRQTVGSIFNSYAA